MKHREVLSAALAALLAGQGCAVGPDYQEPEMAIPDAWYQGISRDLKPRTSQLETWWEGFNDPTLDKLIASAREANPTLEIALSRVREARAQRGVAMSQLFPNVNAGGEYSRTRSSEALLFPGQGNPSNLYAVGFDMGWEIDIFGGVRRGVEASEALIGSAAEQYRDVLISLYAEVALNYIEARTTEQRLKVARQNAVLQESSLKITTSRLDSGLAPKIDVTQAQSNLYRTESFIPALEQQLTFSRNRITTLLGGFPGSQDDLLIRGSRGIPRPVRDFGYGLPADLLRSRPDVRTAERDLAAQTAIIGVAVSDLYPKFSLFGDFGWAARDSSDWLKSSSRTWSFGPAFRWNIFSAGRIRNNIRVEEERAQQAYQNYENTVLGAVEEVETSMVAVVKEQQRLVKLEQSVAANQETVSLIQDNYTSGLVDFQNVLDAERSLFDAEDAKTTSEGLVSTNYVRLFKALGGGAPIEEVEVTLNPDAAQDVAEGEPAKQKKK